MKQAWHIVLLLWGLSLALTAHAQVDSSLAPPVFTSAAEEARFHRLTSELRCVQCQNQSLADSNALVARDLRREVLALMREGRDDAQVKAFLVARYGEFVLYRPQMERSTWALWFGPLAIVMVAALVLWQVVRRNARKLPVTATPDTATSEGQEW